MIPWVRNPQLNPTGFLTQCPAFLQNPPRSHTLSQHLEVLQLLLSRGDGGRQEPRPGSHQAFPPNREPQMNSEIQSCVPFSRGKTSGISARLEEKRVGKTWECCWLAGLIFQVILESPGSFPKRGLEAFEGSSHSMRDLWSSAWVPSCSKFFISMPGQPETSQSLSKHSRRENQESDGIGILSSLAERSP